MRVTHILMGAVMVTSLFASAITASPSVYAKKDAHRFSLCHATGSAKNPYVKITVDYHAFTKQGHDQHQDGRDIIPAVAAYGYPGKNLDKLNILEAGCVVNQTSKPETPGKTPTPVTPQKPIEKPAKPGHDNVHKYTICHATRSVKNPYRVITVDYHSLIKMGHDGHDDAAATTQAEAQAIKTAGEHWGDVIPAIATKNYAGLNWDADGQALLKNNCQFAAHQATPQTPEKPVVDTPDTPGTTDTEPEENIVLLGDAAFTDTPGFGALPQTGALGTAPFVIAAAGALTAGAAYLGSLLRRFAK